MEFYVERGLYFRFWGLHVDCMISIRTLGLLNALVPLRP